jgi:exonuclease VII small subunit
MPFLQHFKEIQLIVLKEVVQYRIPVYFERPYVNFAKYVMRIENGDIVLEFPVKENCKTFVENAEERREAKS